MNKILMIVVALLVLVSTAAFASPSPCMAEPLAAYLVPGFSCTINALTFGDWSYSSTGTGMGGPIPATGVMVTPVPTPGNEGFQFQAGWSVSNLAGADVVHSTEDSLIGFTASGPGIIDLELFFNGSVTGSGQTAVTENFCLNHSLSGCPAGQAGQIKVTNPPPGFNDHVFFASAGSVSVSKDILVDTGAGRGSAMISQVINNFSSPEPLSFVLLGTGLLGLGLMRKRMKR